VLWIAPVVVALAVVKESECEDDLVVDGRGGEWVRQEAIPDGRDRAPMMLSVEMRSPAWGACFERRQELVALHEERQSRRELC
jgi:hypothetical protein